MSFSADKDIAKILYNLGASMIKDDASDLGWTTYKNRRLHHYAGRHAPNHSQPVHHWQVGTLMCIASQLMALASTAIDAQNTYAEIQAQLNEGEENDSKLS